MVIGWCGEGLFSFAEQTVDDSNWPGALSFDINIKGYMNAAGVTVINLDGRGYKNAGSFRNGLAWVVNGDGLAGFIDKSGREVIPCIYDNVSSFYSDGLCFVEKDGKYGYIDKTGEVVIPIEYDGAYGAGGGLDAVVMNGKCGLVDINNNVVVPLEYDDISNSTGGVAYAIKDGLVYIITVDTSDDNNEPETPYTITFDANGGTVSPASAETGDDGKLSSLPTPTHSGFTFDGWYTAAEGGTKVDETTVFTGDTTVYAHWKAADGTYTITLDANGGVVSPTSVTTGTDGKVSSLPTPTRTGYTFAGWFTAASGGTEVTKDTVFAEDTTVYAHWTQNSGGGSGGSSGGGGGSSGGGSSGGGGSSSGGGSSTGGGASTGGSSSGDSSNGSTDGSSSTPSDSGGISVTIGDKAVVWTDAKPFIDENNRTMTPLRAIAEAMSLEVSWDPVAREAIFTDGTKTIIFPIGSTTARTGDGTTIQMDTAAIIVNDRTHAPVRYLAEFFGYAVDWDAEAQNVIIKYN